MTTEALYKLFWYMLEASGVTVQIFFFTLLIGLPLGLLVAVGRMSKWVIIREPIKLYLLIMRGTPLILQLMFFYFAPAYIFGVTLSRINAAILAFTLNYAAYFCEIYRSGIESIPAGQWEAGTILGFTKTQTFFKIILPQVIKRVLPPMGSEFMVLIKDTALANVIGVAEMYQMATNNMSRTASILPLIMAGIFYLVMNSVVSKGFSIMEKRLDYYN